MEIITLNLIPSGVYQTCHVSQNDNERRFRAKLVDGSVPYEIKDGDVLSINIQKPDKNVVTAELTADVGDTYVDVEVTDDMCDIDGTNLCDIRIINAGSRISTSNFYMMVEVDPVANPPEPPPPPSRRGGLDVIIYEQISTTYETL